MSASRAAQFPMAVVLLVPLVVSCGSDEEPPPTDHYAIEAPGIIINYTYSSVASTYIKMLGLDLQVPRATYIEEADDEKHEPIVHWVENLDEATANEGKALLTEELVAVYEADSVPFGEKNESPFCRIHITLPPSINNDFTVRLSTDDTYAPETQALLDYLFGVYEQYAALQ